MATMRRVAPHLLVLLVVAAAVTGCSSSKKSSGTTPGSKPASTVASGSKGSGTGPVKVDIDNFAFKPKSVTVKVGQAVDFVNDDDVTHTATAKDKTFDTGDLAHGASKTVTFSKPGTYQYICSIHNYMTGTVTVTG